jgi:hypothetical protein
MQNFLYVHNKVFKTIYDMCTSSAQQSNSNKFYRQQVPQRFFFCFFDILLTAHLSILISVINQLDVQNFCFTIILFHASTCFEHYALIIRRSRLHYTASGIITLKQVSALKLLNYDSINMSKIVVKSVCEFFGCDYCVLLTVNMSCHVEVMFIQLLNLLERYYVYLHFCYTCIGSLDTYCTQLLHVSALYSGHLNRIYRVRQ